MKLLEDHSSGQKQHVDADAFVSAMDSGDDCGACMQMRSGSDQPRLYSFCCPCQNLASIASFAEAAVGDFWGVRTQNAASCGSWDHTS